MTDRRKLVKPLKTLPTIIGWMEYVDLPDLPLHDIKAKIDTGARTSALHAEDIRRFTRDGHVWVSFRTESTDGGPDVWIEAPVKEKRNIKNTSGVPENRIVIRTTFRLGDQSWPVDLSLTDRKNMTFQMIVGRAALKNHSIAVHTMRAHLLRGRPKRKEGKENR
ncbi:ATP-dependent zinc protease [Ruegeria sediminis]|uniref:ATP-dependent zinc protease n=1 Tax=Ruegeria sediminis TaxID=2583820 RepID=A0ABY2WWK4_9RHOB|nr:RimK/LysX family protein [Ruegeria sediminis]TMV07139.1 ATP-dependent zinc protease [Ruegeria sediminis]